jgi:hypothetical protein
VFILADLSNSEGHKFGAADPKRNEGKGSLEYVAKQPTPLRTRRQPSKAPTGTATPWRII